MDQGRNNNIPLYYFKLILIISSTSLRFVRVANKVLIKITIICLQPHSSVTQWRVKTMKIEEKKYCKSKILNEKIIAYPFLISFPYIIATPWWRVCCCCWATIVYHYYFFFLTLSFFEKNIMEWMKVPFYCDHKASLSLPFCQKCHHRQWRNESHTLFFLFDNDSFWVFKLLTFFFSSREKSSRNDLNGST